MQEYDITLKGVLRRLSGSVLAGLTGFCIKTWHNIELPDVSTRSADLLGETEEGHLVHIELQSTNDPSMAIRMAQYALAIFKLFGKMPNQFVLYVGAAALRMPSGIEHSILTYRYRLLDLRDIDGEAWLESPHLDDNMIAILMRLRDKRAAVRGILRRIGDSKSGERGKALTELTTLAGLRHLGAIMKEETTRMPILTSIMDHDLFGPAIMQGRRETTENFVRSRFGPLPDWAHRRLEEASATELDDIASHIFTAPSLEDLLNPAN